MTEKDELKRRIGNNVRKNRMERSMTQHQLADLANCDNSAITRIEGGARMMSISMLLTVAHALGVSCDALLSEDSPDVHISNITSMLQGQSQESLARIERFVRLLLQEYEHRDADHKPE